MQVAEGFRARLRTLERFDARAAIRFLRLFGAALVVDVATEIMAGVWHVHTGRFYPWRNVGIVPLYPASVLAIEWSLRTAAGLMLLAGARHAKVTSAAVRIAALVLFVAVLERYSNHGVLLFLIAFYLTLAPLDVTAPSFGERDQPALGLVRAQLAIVYLFSAVNKLAHGFAGGHSLSNILGPALAPGHAAQALSVLVIATELALPFVLLRWPRAGLAVVVAMHAAFAALVPGVVSFGLAMIAMAVLFAAPSPSTRTSLALPE